MQEEECSGLGCYCWEPCQGRMMQNSPALMQQGGKQEAAQH